jgi:hypothetical protein
MSRLWQVLELTFQQILILDRGGGTWYGHKVVNTGTRFGRPEMATVPFFATEEE